MSLEQDIQELTKAVKELTAALGRAEKPATVKKSAEKTEPANAGSQPGVTPLAEEKKGAAPVTPPAPFPFKKLADEATKLVEKDYDKLAAICKREGVAKISGLPDAKWEAVHDEIVGILASLEKPASDGLI
jgi:hypothetical protein